MHCVAGERNTQPTASPIFCLKENQDGDLLHRISQSSRLGRSGAHDVLMDVFTQGSAALRDALAPKSKSYMDPLFTSRLSFCSVDDFFPLGP